METENQNKFDEEMKHNPIISFEDLIRQAKHVLIVVQSIKN